MAATLVVLNSGSLMLLYESLHKAHPSAVAVGSTHSILVKMVEWAGYQTHFMRENECGLLRCRRRRGAVVLGTMLMRDCLTQLLQGDRAGPESSTRHFPRKGCDLSNKFDSVRLYANSNSYTQTF